MPDVKIIADIAEHEQSRAALLEDSRLAQHIEKGCVMINA